MFIDLNRQVDYKLMDFLKWNMEGEHGDLGLESTYHDKPPLSKLGKQLQGPRKQELQSMFDEILFQSAGNIGMAKMRIDLVHEHGEAHANSGMLPDAVTNMFDAVINGMMSGSGPDSRPTCLGIRAIVAFTLLSRRSNSKSVKFKQLATALVQEESVEAHAMHTVLHAASGLLVVERAPVNGSLIVLYYHRSFEAYMIDRYSKILWEIEQDMSRDPGMLALLRAWEVETPRLVEWLTEVDENRVEEDLDGTVPRMEISGGMTI